MLSWSTDIKIFSEAGLERLANVKTQLELIQKVEYRDAKASSPYSKKMIDNTIAIIELLIKNNSVSYWKKSDNQKKLLELTNFLDNKKETFVPEVFNEQSLDLARTILNFFRKIKLENFLNFTALTAIKTVVNDPAKSLQTLCDNLEFKIQFYEKFVRNFAQHRENIQLCEAIDMKFKGLIMDIANLTEENLESFKLSYSEYINEALHKINELDYVRMCNSESLVNREAPHTYSHVELESRGNRALLLSALANLEIDLNLALDKKFPRQENAQPHISHVYRVLKESFSIETFNKVQTEFVSIIEQLIKDKEGYKKGEHFGTVQKLFRSVNSDKVAALEDLIEQIIKYLKDQIDNDPTEPTGRWVFKCFTFTMAAVKLNEEICKASNISLGQLSKITAETSMKFFMLSFSKIDQTCDNGLLRPLTAFEKLLKQPPGLNYAKVRANTNVANFLDHLRSQGMYLHLLNPLKEAPSSQPKVDSASKTAKK